MTTFGEFIGGEKRIIGGPFGSNLTQADYTVEGVPVIRGSNMEQNGRWIGGDFAFVSAEKVAADLRSNLARPGDIIVTQRGTMGQVSIIPEDSFATQFVISQSQMAISVDPNSASRDFTYYYLRSPQFSEYLGRSIIQTGVPHINLGILRKAPAEWPDLPVQNAIASILGTLDDKIELNQRMNETLEAMARTIFKDWFVDFGPTRAKMEGSVPYLSPDMWSLFPRRLDDIGKPEDWSLGTMSDLLVLQRGFDLPSQARLDGPHPIISASGPNGFHNSYMVKGPGVATGRSGVLGKVFFIHENFWPLNTSLWVKEFRRATPCFAYCYLSNIDFSSFNAGSAVPTLNRNHVHGLPTPVPPEELVLAFDGIVMPLFRRQHHNQEEANTLSAMRNFLLPKLLSGELQVKDAEKLVGKAT